MVCGKVKIVQKLEMLGDDKSGLFFLDQELGKRVFTPSATAGQPSKAE